MSKPDRSIDPRILQSAKEEFLEKGFLAASLKDICMKAEVTTGALYKRYRGKEELFCAVVADTVADLDGYVTEKCSLNPVDLSDEMLIKAWDMDEEYMLWWFKFLYDRHDGFVLLIKGGEGTSYSNFQHDWLQKMTDATYGYYKEAYRRGLATKKISEKEMHIMLTAFWTTIFEPFIHGFDWEQIANHNKLICELFDWHGVLGFS
ncbi:MAG: TetR/AcrR family transcriptional regulator [Anaerotignum sp.]|nr:TetR/AcrR family transcriptional regulator [Anaerotignum sp.]